MSSILVIGDIYAENQYFVERMAKAEEFVVADAATSSYGSKTVNASRVFARLENEVNFYAHVGNDLDGGNIIYSLESWLISPYIKKVKESKTGKIVVITESTGKSAITLFRGANQTIVTHDIENLKELISESSAVYSSTSLALESLYLLVEMCHLLEKPLFLDVPNQHSQLALKKLSSVDFFVPNRQEAGLLLQRSITSIDDAKFAAEELRKSIAGTIIITLDKDGCVVLEKNENVARHIETQVEDSVDETAAGDIFRAVFFDDFLKKNSIDEAIQKALKIASRSTKILGVDKTLMQVELI